MKFYMYVHAKPDGTPFYVGKGSGNRAYDLNRVNEHHRAVVAKYGAENILVVVLPYPTEQAAFDAECDYIRILRADGVKLSNRTDGGEGIANMSEEVRAKISASKKGSSHSIITRAKMSAARWGVKQGPRKNPLSVETRMKMSASRMGHVVSEETRAKLSAKLKGRIFSDETRARMSEAHKRK